MLCGRLTATRGSTQRQTGEQQQTRANRPGHLHTTVNMQEANKVFE